MTVGQKTNLMHLLIHMLAYLPGQIRRLRIHKRYATPSIFKFSLLRANYLYLISFFFVRLDGNIYCSLVKAPIPSHLFSYINFKSWKLDVTKKTTSNARETNTIEEILDEVRFIVELRRGHRTFRSIDFFPLSFPLRRFFFVIISNMGYKGIFNWDRPCGDARYFLSRNEHRRCGRHVQLLKAIPRHSR